MPTLPLRRSDQLRSRRRSAAIACAGPPSCSSLTFTVTFRPRPSSSFSWRLILAVIAGSSPRSRRWPPCPQRAGRCGSARARPCSARPARRAVGPVPSSQPSRATAIFRYMMLHSAANADGQTLGAAARPRRPGAAGGPPHPASPAQRLWRGTDDRAPGAETPQGEISAFDRVMAVSDRGRSSTFAAWTRV